MSDLVSAITGAAERPAWTARAACHGLRGAVNFYVERGEDPRPARRICADCPVRSDCLDHAVTNAERFGIWGGLSPKERRRIRRADTRIHSKPGDAA